MPRRLLPPLLSVVAAAALGTLTSTPAEARDPPNPYSSFNLSGINYGSMQWERDQRDGKVVWPYYNVPQRGRSRSSVSAGGASGTAAAGAVRATNGRGWRRWRR